MAVTDEELRLILSAKDKMSGVVNKNKKALEAMVQIAKGVGLVFAAWRVAKTVIAIGRMGAEVERLNISFRRLAGAAPDEMLNELRKATRGTISDMGLMLNANRAMMLGVTKDAKTMARLTEIAIARGQALGLSAQTSMDRMVTGLGRISTKILDDIGILTGGQKTFDDYAASVGKAADQLTDLEKRQALVNMVLQDNITLTADAASSAERAAAAFENLKRALAVRYARQYGDFMEQLAIRLERTIKWIQSFTGNVDDLNVALEIGNPLLREHMRILEGLPTSYDRAADAVNDLADNLRAMGWKTLGERRMGGTPWQWISVDDIEEAQRLYGMDIESAQWYLSEMAYMRKDAAAAEDEANAEGIRQAEAHGRELVRARQKALQELRGTVEKLLQPTAVTELDMAKSRLGEYTDKWDEYVRRIRAGVAHLLEPKDWGKLVPKDIKKQGKEAVRQWISWQQEMAERWKGMIPEDVLARGVDAIKVWAAETEQAFYAGLIPEEIDWEAFDRAFEQFMREKAGREAMIQEAMKRTGATQADIEFMLGYSGDVVQGASVAMKEIAATKGPIETIKDALPIFKSNLDIAGSAASALGISSGPLDKMKSLIDDVNAKLDQFEDALEKAQKALEPPPPTEEEPTTGEGLEGIGAFTADESVTTAVGGGAVGHGATVVFAAGSVVVTGTGGPGATRRDTETGMLAALRAAGMPI